MFFFSHFCFQLVNGYSDFISYFCKMFGGMAIKKTVIQIFDASNIFLDIAHFR